jgi:hypothetical protein
MPDDIPEFIDPVEDCPERPPREIFARFGYEPLPPLTLTDQQLPGRLWELLYAAASRRFFFSDTNHLSDRQLYTLLWEDWLDQPTADIPIEAETNTHWTVSELNALGMTHKEIYLRYYATDDDRTSWKKDFGESLPPHEDPPYDRDRFLPVPPFPLEAHAGWLPGDGDDGGVSDPLGLAAVDDALANIHSETTVDVEPMEPGHSALEAQLRAVEPENWTPLAEQLATKKIPLLPPAEITDETLVPVLWELLHNLALQGFYILHSDHLSDRELYQELWERGLRDPAHLPGRNPRGGWFHDFLGSWGEEDMLLWLRYYANDDERAKHLQEWPKDTLPPKEKPCANRDWRLPKGPF